MFKTSLLGKKNGLTISFSMLQSEDTYNVQLNTSSPVMFSDESSPLKDVMDKVVWGKANEMLNLRSMAVTLRH